MDQPDCIVNAQIALADGQEKRPCACFEVLQTGNWWRVDQGSLFEWETSLRVQCLATLGPHSSLVAVGVQACKSDGYVFFCLYCALRFGKCLLLMPWLEACAGVLSLKYHTPSFKSVLYIFNPRGDHLYKTPIRSAFLAWVWKSLSPHHNEPKQWLLLNVYFL